MRKGSLVYNVRLFTTRLQLRLTALGLQQTELAGRMGFSLAMVNHWFTGERQPNLTNLTKLATALECTTDYLLGASHRPNE